MFGREEIPRGARSESGDAVSSRSAAAAAADAVAAAASASAVTRRRSAVPSVSWRQCVVKRRIAPPPVRLQSSAIHASIRTHTHTYTHTPTHTIVHILSLGSLSSSAEYACRGAALDGRALAKEHGHQLSHGR